MSLLSVTDLTTRFATRRGLVHAVEGVSFSLEAGETIGLVGESGSGKSVTCYSLMGLIPTPPGKICRGQALFDNRDLLTMSSRELRQVRGKRMSMIFQDPMTSLNPFLTIGKQISEVLELHEGFSSRQARFRAIEALESVGIEQAERRFNDYPHAFSGGMRQRVMIAMALVTRPELLICDEPTTALDVTVQKQVLDLIASLQKAYGTAVILITHDLAVVAQVCHTVHVMYAGRMVESASKDELFAKPLHAYTRALLASIPAAHARGERLTTIPGSPPNLMEPPRGCAFCMRNTLGNSALCLRDTQPVYGEVTKGHFVQQCPGCLHPWEL